MASPWRRVATLKVGPGVAVQIGAGQTLTDNGTLSFATGDTVTFSANYAQIVVDGTLIASGTTFNNQ